jgi:hypothetical protein
MTHRFISSAFRKNIETLQLMRRHLNDGDAPMREFVDELRATRARDLAALDWESSPCEY